MREGERYEREREMSEGEREKVSRGREREREIIHTREQREGARGGGWNRAKPPSFDPF